MNNNSNNTHFIRLSPPKAMLNSIPSVEQKSTELLPKVLYHTLNMYGIRIREEENFSNNTFCSLRNFSCEKLKVFISFIPILMMLIAEILSNNHLTFLVVAIIDHVTYLVAFYFLLHRRNKIIYCVTNVLNIKYNISNTSKSSNYEITSILVGIAVAYSCIYFAYAVGMLVERNEVSDVNWQLACNITNWLLYSIFVCTGIPVQVILLVHISSLVHNALISIQTTLECEVKESNVTVFAIRQHKIAFCKLQKISSILDSIFKELILIWLVKIIFRYCLSAIDIFTRSWSDQDLSTQGVVVFDTVFDISHLAMLCHFGGKIQAAKLKVMESLIYASGKYASERDDIQNELHFMLTLVGHSDIGLTAANIFPLNKSTAVTIFGALGSYSALIYQLTLK